LPVELSLGMLPGHGTPMDAGRMMTQQQACGALGASMLHSKSMINTHSACKFPLTNWLTQEFRLPPLPFDPSATEPVISAQANKFHHVSGDG